MKHYFIIIILIFTLFTGCIDNPVQQNNFLIKGNVYGGIKPFVSINNGPITECEYRGDFEIESPVKPYNLIITDRESWLFDWLTVKYTGITIDSPQLLFYEFMGFGGNHNNDSYKSCYINVLFPELTERKFIITKFISDNEYFQVGAYRNGFPGTYNNNSAVYIPPEKCSITGKLYYLECRFDTININSIYYDNFGIKDVTLFPSEYTDVIFYNTDLSDPIEYNLHFDINLPPEFHCWKTEIILTNSSMNRCADYTLRIIDNASQGNLIIPLVPSNDFKIKIYNEYYNNTFQISLGMRSGFVDIGMPAVVNYNETVNLLSPPDGYDNVTKSTVFEIQDNEGPAIYEYNLICMGRPAKVYTNNKKVQFADFEAWNFELPKNTSYFWTVRKFRNYHSIDEFVTKNIYEENKSDYIEVNMGRSFKTAP